MDSSFVLRTLGTNDSVHLIAACVPGISIRRAMQNIMMSSGIEESAKIK